jgi:hypothetical protein
MAGNESPTPAKGDPFFRGVTENGSDSRFEANLEPDHVKADYDPYLDSNPIPPSFNAGICAHVDGITESLVKSGTYPNFIYTGTLLIVSQLTFRTWIITNDGDKAYHGFGETPASVSFWHSNSTPDVEITDGACAMFTITVTNGANGTVTPSTTMVMIGGDQSFSIVPDDGYVIDDVLVDAVSVGTPSSYEFTNVTEDHTLEAQYQLFIGSFTYTPSGNTSATAGNTYGLAWNDTGSRFYRTNSLDDLEVYDVTTNGDASTKSLVVTIDLSGFGSFPEKRGVYVDETAGEMLLVDGGDNVMRLTFTGPIDGSTVAGDFTNVASFAVDGEVEINQPITIRVSADRLKYYVCCTNLNYLVEFTMTSAWDVTTSSKTDTFLLQPVGPLTTAISSFFFLSARTIITYHPTVSGASPAKGEWRQYSMTADYDISTMSQVGSGDILHSDIPFGGDRRSGVMYSNTANYMYIGTSSTSTLYHFAT